MFDLIGYCQTLKKNYRMFPSAVPFAPHPPQDSCFLVFSLFSRWVSGSSWWWFFLFYGGTRYIT